MYYFQFMERDKVQEVKEYIMRNYSASACEYDANRSEGNGYDQFQDGFDSGGGVGFICNS